MKIEMVLPTLAAAGMEVMVARTARKLAARGHSVGVACIEAGGPLAADLTAGGVPVTVLEAHGLVNPGWLRRVASHLRKVAPDVAHVHSGCWLKGGLAARVAGVPYVIYTAHGFVDRTSRIARLIDRAALMCAHRVVAVSDHLGEHLVASGVPRARLTVIANGIDLDLFRPKAGAGVIRQRLGIAPETMIVGTVARLEAIKNQAVLLEAVALARTRGAQCAAVLIGDGSLRAALGEQAAALGIADHVHFWGLESDVARLYSELDLFVLTSDLEGTSISLLEAMASGVCPVVTAVGGNTALVADGQTGVLFEPRRPDQLATAILDLAARPERRPVLGAAARGHVARHFSDAAMIDAYERLYAEGVRGRR